MYYWESKAECGRRGRNKMIAGVSQVLLLLLCGIVITCAYYQSILDQNDLLFFNFCKIAE